MYQKARSARCPGEGFRAEPFPGRWCEADMQPTDRPAATRRRQLALALRTDGLDYGCIAATADPDGDGLSNAAEATAGTDDDESAARAPAPPSSGAPRGNKPGVAPR